MTPACSVDTGMDDVPVSHRIERTRVAKTCELKTYRASGDASVIACAHPCNRAKGKPNW